MVMDGFPILETDRLRLIEVTQEHQSAVFNVMSRPEVTQYYGMDKLTSIDQASEIIDSFSRNFSQSTAVHWGMVKKSDETFIGTVGLNNLKLWSKKAEIGFELHPREWRKGYTSEAVTAVLRFAFDELQLYRIGAVTFPENIASKALLSGLGFQEEGLLRGYIYQGNACHDAAVFSVLSPEFNT
ncbi:GNAT family N-acetyltransferase [Thalassobacillus sp. CUG 92003]|uniref:GNAT family N-acetyltransferase n=1 Tax=Thalassobacillus sp. CUG 92003 TaxID=2736641 RepID=UPI0015E6D947|nr:GNAT family N-acetyltransferase [Thalassobacillus sp. CUG 92003]